MGGRIDDIAAVEQNPYIIYVAFATNGLWKSTNNGTTQFNNVQGGTSSGAKTISFRYALASGSRTGTLTVNGVSQSITFTSTGSWTTWSTLNVTVNLNAGTTNTLILRSTGADLGNVDSLTVP